MKYPIGSTIPYRNRLWTIIECCSDPQYESYYRLKWQGHHLIQHEALYEYEIDHIFRCTAIIDPAELRLLLEELFSELVVTARAYERNGRYTILARRTLLSLSTICSADLVLAHVSYSPEWIRRCMIKALDEDTQDIQAGSQLPLHE